MNNERKLNILLVHNYYQLPGGEDVVFKNEKRLLEEHGHNVITYTRHNDELKKLNLLQKLLLPFTIIFNIKTYNDIKNIIKRNDIDIVHVHNTLSLISPAVFYASVKMNTPVVHTLHNFRLLCPNGIFYRDGHICEDCVNSGLKCALKNKCYRNSFFQTLAVVLMTSIHRLTGIYKKINLICLTEFNKGKVLLLNKRSQLVDCDKIYVKPNFVFDGTPNIEVNHKRKNNKNNNYGNDYYLFAGRLDEIKGIDIALDAFSQMPDMNLYVVGSGGDEYRHKFSKHSNISFVGQVSHDKMLDIMRYAKALIFPSKWYEGMPMNIIEAYSCGTPVISSDIGNAKDLVIEGRTGMHFKSCDIDSLIDVVVDFESANMALLNNNVLNEYDIKYSSQVGYYNLLKVYNDIISISYGSDVIK